MRRLKDAFSSWMASHPLKCETQNLEMPLMEKWWVWVWGINWEVPRGPHETMTRGLEVRRRICTVARHVETRTLWGRRVSSLWGESSKATKFRRKAEEAEPLRSSGGLGRETGREETGKFQSMSGSQEWEQVYQTRGERKHREVSRGWTSRRTGTKKQWAGAMTSTLGGMGSNGPTWGWRPGQSIPVRSGLWLYLLIRERKLRCSAYLGWQPESSYLSIS